MQSMVVFDGRGLDWGGLDSPLLDSSLDARIHRYSFSLLQSMYV